MKKLLALLLAATMLLTVTACGGAAEPVETTTASVVENTTLPLHEEVIPDIEMETMPPAFEENMSRDQLTAYYADYMKNHNWSQYSGMHCKSADIEYRYAFTNESVIWEIKQMSQAYEGSIRAQEIEYSDMQTHERYLMGDLGSFGYIDETGEVMPYPVEWTIFNEQTTSWYLKTESKTEIYDIIQFETSLTRKNSNNESSERISYTVQWLSDVCEVSYTDGKWKVKMYNDQTVFEHNVNFDPDTKILTVNNDSFEVTILRAPGEKVGGTTLDVIRGLLYINRETQEIAYMEDMDTGVKVSFLVNPTVEFTMPANVRYEDFPEDYISDMLKEFKADTSRYIK